MKKTRNPLSLGIVRGPGIAVASDNFPQFEEFQVVELSFQLISDSMGVVGYADMDVEKGSRVLRHLFGQGDAFEVRLDSGLRELNVGDFGIWLESEKDRALIVAKY